MISDLPSGFIVASLRYLPECLHRFPASLVENASFPLPSDLFSAHDFLFSLPWIGEDLIFPVKDLGSGILALRYSSTPRLP